jgi:hypothetical protein
MKATAGSSETPVNLYQIVRRHNMVIFGMPKFALHFCDLNVSTRASYRRKRQTLMLDMLH